MKLKCNKNNPPLSGIITAEYVTTNLKKPIQIEWAEETVFEGPNQKISCATGNDVCRAIARIIDEVEMYGATPLEKTEIDHWLTFAIGPLASKTDFLSGVQYLNKILGPLTYLTSKRISIADFSVFASLFANSKWHGLVSKKEVPVHVLRWYNYIKSQTFVASVLLNLPAEAKASLSPPVSSRQSLERTNAGGRAQEGKFVDLPGAEMGKVVVRFPPEASGYLHIGHAKAALLNQYYQQAFNGKLIMRFDDTNPAKENVHFEKVILEDVEMLEIKPDLFTHTSQYFDLMLEYCEKMIKDGKAYADDTDPETMKSEREQKLQSKNRNNSYDKNNKMWQEMRKGSEIGQKCCIRAKIDMQSPNGCMRDPTIYRCKNEPHPRTGTLYKVYPTYDFACPIVDAIEGVTHTLRTMEYHDRDPQFYWFNDVLGLRKPYIWEYSRLSMTNTVLSKRKLTWFVQEGLVDGWDDPRFPTVRGVLRRGMTVEGLKQFIIAQGSSRSVVFMEWDKIWAFNKKVIDPIAPRYTALALDNSVPVLLKGVKEEKRLVARHPKNTEVGEKEMWIGPKILIDMVDAECLKENENTTFINWGNLLIKKINRENGVIKSVEAEPNLGNTDYKKTLKLTWLAENEIAKFTPTWCVYFDHIISKPLLGKDDDFKQFVGHNTRNEVQMLGDPELKKLKKGDIIQLQRRGYYRVDQAYAPLSLNTCKAQPVILFYIPDGHAKESPTVGAQSQTTNAKQQTKSTDVPEAIQIKSGEKSATLVNEAIIKQGDIVRCLKAQKAAKGEVDSAIKNLLALKDKYRELTNTDWKPGCVPPSTTPISPESTTSDLNVSIAEQGEKVRKLKAEKAIKETIDKEVKTLLALKSEYKQKTGRDWTPTIAAPVVKNVGTVDEILKKITEHGDNIRDLKSKKAEKSQIDAEVKVLLSLKAEYKAFTGQDWKPGTTAAPSPTTSTGHVTDENTILQQIADQGNKVRELKLKKADKASVEIEVKKLLELKTNYKNLTGRDWKPGTVPAQSAPSKEIIKNNPVEEVTLLEKISQQGDKVRQLKTDKAEKSIVDVEVKLLLSLKGDFKALTGKDWKPVMHPTSATNTTTPVVTTTAGGDNKVADLTSKITDQGNVVRQLKTNKSAEQEIKAAVDKLLELKAQYKTLTGTDFPVAGRTPSKPKEKEKVMKQKPAAKEKKPVDAEEAGPKKLTRLGLEAKKEENLSDWYSQVITKGEMIEYYDVSGCYILRPWSFAVWESIKDWFDCEIKKLGVQNCYFPIFVSRSVLEREKSHIADFAPEVAWVTKSGDSDMAEPIAVRPTSETVMYPAYAKWIQSYRDLPILLNQWNNVVRWEFKHPQPFLRTREFLWQEGHTAYAVQKDAQDEVLVILDLYAKIYTDLLAIPVVKGRKTEKEKFAGGDYTYTVEAFVSASGRAIQGATSHHLGQNFSKMFNIIYDDPDTQEKKYVYQNSWGITTRTIGVMIMIHADNQGLVLPPKVACIQIVIVPCGVTVNLSEADRCDLQSSCEALESELKDTGIRVKGDYRDNYSPGWKFNHWELKGVPIRIELGPKDLKNKQLVAVRRDTGEKIVVKRESAAKDLAALLEGIQKNLYNKALNDLNSHKVQINDWAQFTPNLDQKNIILAPFCGEMSCEDNIKADSTRDDSEAAEPGAPSMGAKSLCIPSDQPASIKDTDKCIHPSCKNKPKFYTLFGRSY